MADEPRALYRRARSDKYWNNRIFWTVVLMVIAGLLSAAKPVVLPDGGAVTYFSLLFLWLLTFFFGPRYGFVAGALFGFVKLGVTIVTGEYVNYEIGAIILEYPIACGAFALGGLALRKTGDGGVIPRDVRGLRLGYIIGVLAMGVCYIISAFLFYPPMQPEFLANVVDTIIYDMSYLLIEAAITMILLLIPQVLDVIFYLKHVATHDRSDPTLRSF